MQAEKAMVRMVRACEGKGNENGEGGVGKAIQGALHRRALRAQCVQGCARCIGEDFPSSFEELCIHPTPKKK